MNEFSKRKKLTKKDFDRMWGEDGPYSQVRLCEETRILDDRVSRVFLVVEAEINPFTFECVREHRAYFANDEPILQMLDHAEYRGKFGYVVSAGEVELDDEESKRFARKQANMAVQTLIRMHKFVMETCGISSDSEFGVIKENMPYGKNPLVWNEETGRIEPAKENDLWGEETLIKSPAGMRNNKMRFFVVCAFKRKFDLKKAAASAFAKALKKSAEDFQVEIENCEIFMEYMLITALLPFDTAPADFIEAALDACNQTARKPIFKKDYLVTNVKKPTPEEIMSFLAQLPMDRDIEMPL